MPIVCYHVKSNDKYVIVDGFHRWRVMRDYPDIYVREKGMMPVSIIDKPLSGRMASTIRHNRARGTHDVDLMSNIIKELYEWRMWFRTKSPLAVGRRIRWSKVLDRVQVSIVL